MTGTPARAPGGFDSPGGLRLDVALVAAVLLHAALIAGLDFPSRDSGFSTPAIDFTLAVESAPARTGNAGHEAVHHPAGPGTVGTTPAGSVPAADTRHSPPIQDLRVDDSAPPAAAPSPVTDAAGPPGASGPAHSVDASPTARRTGSADGQAGKATGALALPYGELAREIASAHAQRERQEAAGAGRPKTKRLTSTSAKSGIEAAYLNMWRQKIERIGRANYPAGRISGELLLLAVIHQDGALEEVRILESSGHPALDEAALRVVRLAAPYSHFPTEMRKSYDRLEIVRRWRFARAGSFL